MALHVRTVLLAATLELLEHPNVAIAPKVSMPTLWGPQRVHSALLAYPVKLGQAAVQTAKQASIAVSRPALARHVLQASMQTSQPKRLARAVHRANMPLVEQLHVHCTLTATLVSSCPKPPVLSRIGCVRTVGWASIPTKPTRQVALAVRPGTIRTRQGRHHVLHVWQASMLQRLTPLSVLTALLVDTSRTQAPQLVQAVSKGTPQMVL